MHKAEDFAGEAVGNVCREGVVAGPWAGKGVHLPLHEVKLWRQLLSEHGNPELLTCKPGSFAS